MAEPISNSQIFPYINAMVEEMRIAPPNEVGFYSDLVMVLFRGLNAALCGISPVVHSIMSDITDKINQHGVFPLAGLAWDAGEMIGSLITAVAITAIATVLKETHPHLKDGIPHDKDLSIPPESMSYASCQNNDTKGRPTTASSRGQTLGLLSDPSTVRYILFARLLTAFLTDGFGKVLVLWSYTPLSMSRLQRSPGEIGMMLSISGILGVFTSNVIFPNLYRRSNDSVAVFATCMSIWCLAFALLPLVGLTVRKMVTIPQVYDHAPSLGGLWGLVVVLIILQQLAAMAHPAFILMTNDAALDPASTGALFGLATTAGTLGGAVAPAFTTVLFAISVEKRPLGGNLVWIVMNFGGCVRANP
ncbi:hypothetical protein M407DRAFT_23955 [Tulasnella calospora MUT 4182]|uniref:Major facilitator superfamily (MFS) profile domain-containing protein n=1 Tax=Tulasnella calospora MUT 4182 TaxID=1051891 RepID=A0A0C3QK88_9AGAM|nr:hypothetical protein M407DRAFT_23955 [Tulasnella calospora MUT 4182]